jgi:hypothetical protein
MMDAISYIVNEYGQKVYTYRIDGTKEYVVVFSEYNDKIYEGEWVNGKRHGWGKEFDTYVKENVTVCSYEGHWVNDNRDGYGVSFRRDGSKMYEGYWEQGERHGPGRSYTLHGHVWIRGEWKDGDIFIQEYKRGFNKRTRKHDEEEYYSYYSHDSDDEQDSKRR